LVKQKVKKTKKREEVDISVEFELKEQSKNRMRTEKQCRGKRQGTRASRVMVFIFSGNLKSLPAI